MSRYRLAKKVAAQGGMFAGPDSLLEAASVLCQSPENNGTIRALAYAIESIDRAARASEPEKWRSVVDEAEHLALSITKRLGIKPRDSQATRLFSDIFHAKSRFHRSTGEPWHATWYSLFALSQDGGQRLPKNVDLDSGARVLARVLAQVMDSSSDPPVDEAARVRKLRLRGDHIEALAYVDRALTASPASAEPALRLEQALCQVHLCASTEPLKRWLRSGSSTPERTSDLLLLLYAHAVPSRTESRGLTVPAGSSEMHDVVRVVHDLYNVAVPIEDRLRLLGTELYTRLAQVQTETGLVLLAGVARWLHRRQQTALYRLVASVYRMCSLSLSEGQRVDVLGLMGDITAKRGLRSQPKVDTLHVYPDWHRRTGYTAAITARLAGEMGMARLRRLFTPTHRKKRLRDQERDSLHALMVVHLGRMKGPLMKIAQHVGYLGLDLSERSESGLHQLFDQSSSVEAESIRSIVESELGQSLDKVFREFSAEPVGCGSIGQVHRAVLLNGQEVAVKVQYPNVEEAIGHDFWNLSLICPIAKLLAPEQDWAGLLEEARKQVTLECDYRREAKMQSLFRDAYREHEFIRIPEVHHHLVTKRVLTTEYIDGTTFMDHTDRATQGQKDQLVEALCRLVHRPIRGAIARVDSNPGNYIFRDGQMYVLDFGGVVELSLESMYSWLELAWALAAQDMPMFRRKTKERNWVKDPNHFDYQAGLAAAGITRAADAVRPDGRLSIGPRNIRNLLRSIVLMDGMAIQPQWFFLARGQASLFCLLGHLGCALDEEESAAHFEAALIDCERRLDIVATQSSRT